MLKNEKGSITIYVLGVMLFFCIILVGVLASSNNSRKNQKNAESTVLDNYKKDVDMVNIIYNEKIEQYKKLNNENIAEVKWIGSSVEGINLVANAKMYFFAEDLTDINNFKYFVDDKKEYVGETSNKWNTAETVNNNISAQGTIQNIQIENNKINFIHVLIEYDSEKKIEIVSNGLRYDNTKGKNAVASNRTLLGTTTGYTYKNPVIPQGFYTVDTEDASWTYKQGVNQPEVEDWNEGLVISDGTNEFVWVPVDGTDVTYERDTTFDSYGVNSILENPTDTTTEPGDGKTYKVIPVNDEEKQIRDYGGFYVARYESGQDIEVSDYSFNPLSKKNSKICKYIDYKHAYVAADKMINIQNGQEIIVQSGLITGKQWDTIMKWYKINGIGVEKTTQNWGNYFDRDLIIPAGNRYFFYYPPGYVSFWSTESSDIIHTGNTNSMSSLNKAYYYETGIIENNYKKNIADMAGNEWEWTAETCGSNRIYRGGSGDNFSFEYPASYRISYDASHTAHCLGFRCVLYVQ